MLKDVEIDSTKLAWLGKEVDKFLLGDKIEKTFDKYFFSLPMEVKPRKSGENSTDWFDSFFYNS